MASKTGFRHVRVENLWHSICLCCFHTVAEAETEIGVKTAEATHRCDLSLSERPVPKEPSHWSSQ
jgi:hypothetical protein